VREEDDKKGEVPFTVGFLSSLFPELEKQRNEERWKKKRSAKSKRAYPLSYFLSLLLV